MLDDDREKARRLEAWLMGLDLPPRVINLLRRDLEVVLGEREGVPGKSGGLAGLDRAGFEQELYRPEGGAIRRLSAVGALVIETLREAILRPHDVAAAPAPAAEADESQLRALWRELHPQGRRAVLGYISELLIR